jgi:hypothetical protein
MDKRWTESELRTALDRYESELRRAGKARNTIATYVQHPERFINWLVGEYRPKPAGGQNRPVSKYDPLQRHLESVHDDEIKMRFEEIESVLGRSLPASARRHRPWWANETGGSHTHARAWLNAGRRTRDVDLRGEIVVFHR